MLDTIRTTRVAGLDLTPASLDQALQYLSTTTYDGAGRSIHLVNSYTAVLADQDQAYAATLDDDVALLLADGTPLVWLSKLTSSRDFEGVRGPTLMRRALLDGQVAGRRHFLLGSTDENLGLLSDQVAALGHSDSLVGTYSPPYGPIEGAEWALIVDMVRESGADVVWVGLGTPLQDNISVRLAKEAAVSAVAVGAAFDFLAGTKKEAPRWLHGTGLEWIYRLATEPKRLWRRYLVGNTQFLRIALPELVRRRKSSVRSSQ